jgi:hypothetical protein
MALPPGGPIADAYAKKIEDYQATIGRYEQEKKQIEAKARELESERDDAKRHNKPFGMAVMFLQVAILLNSISGLLKVKRIWWTSIPVGLVGVGFFLDGFFAIF